MLNGYVHGFAYGARVGREVAGTHFCLQNGDPHGHFSYLGLNIEEMFVTGRPTYPVERTLLTSGMTIAAVDSLHQSGAVIETPQMEVRYSAPKESLFWRE